jgi:hypothetical protein
MYSNVRCMRRRDRTTMLFGEETQLFARVAGSSVAVLWEWIRSSDHIIDVIKCIITNQFRLS